MKTGRLEAFSDGVLAIIITIMVLELKAPKGSDFGINASNTGFSDVFIKFCLCGNLLE